MGTQTNRQPLTPTLKPLGDSAMIIVFSPTASLDANIYAVAFAKMLNDRGIRGILEIVPNLVSVLVRYNPLHINFRSLSNELSLLLSSYKPAHTTPTNYTIDVVFGGEGGPDLSEVCATLDMSEDDFIAAHNASPLRILTTGFAPGFVYCGIHIPTLNIARRSTVRPKVPAGSILFAAGQTAIAATDLPTGWHVIGRTEFRNFDPYTMPPTVLSAGDLISFKAI